MRAVTVFITGGTGYIGKRLIPLLIERGHAVSAIVRAGSEKRLPKGVRSIVADPLRDGSYADKITGADVFIHLIGTPHPSPAKAKQFGEIDLVSIQVAARAASSAGVRHFIYVSVAHPAPMMKEFIAVRSEGERLLEASGMNATFVRPWYVLGPGHRWPYALIPFYWILEMLPGSRESARRLGLVSLKQMLNALVWATEHPPVGVRVVDVPKIRELSRKRTS